MSRKASITTLLIEVVSLLIFGTVMLTWFGGLESLIGGASESIAVRNFRQFLAPIEAVCRNQTQEASALGLSITAFGKTNIITQLIVPSSFLNNPEDAGMLPPQLRKCVGATCLCLFQLNEWAGNWKCTTGDWDVTSLVDGVAPGCPFWYYNSPALTEQLVANALAILSLGTTLFENEIIEAIEGAERNIYYYPAPEYWGGCVFANKNNLYISSFSGDAAEFDCSYVVDMDIYKFMDIDKSRIKNDVTSKIIVDDNGLQDIIDTEFTDYLAGKANNTILDALINASPETFKENMKSSTDSIMKSALKEGYKSLKDDFEVLLRKVVFSDLSAYPLSLIYNWPGCAEVDGSTPCTQDDPNWPLCALENCRIKDDVLDHVINDLSEEMASVADNVTDFSDSATRLFFKAMFDKLVEDKFDASTYFSAPGIAEYLHNNLINNASALFNSTLDSIASKNIYASYGTDYCFEEYSPIRDIALLKANITQNLYNNFSLGTESAADIGNIKNYLLIQSLSGNDVINHFKEFGREYYSGGLYDHAKNSALNDYGYFASDAADIISSDAGSDIKDELLDALIAYSRLFIDNMSNAYMDYYNMLFYDYCDLSSTCYDNACVSNDCIKTQGCGDDEGCKNCVDACINDVECVKNCGVSEDVLENCKSSQQCQPGILDAVKNGVDSYFSEHPFTSEFNNNQDFIANFKAKLDEDLNKIYRDAVDNVRDKAINIGYLGPPYNNFYTLIKSVTTDLMNRFSEAIYNRKKHAYKHIEGGLQETYCWPGPPGLHVDTDKDYKDWFIGYSTINDLLALNRYTSTDRIVPQALGYIITKGGDIIPYKPYKIANYAFRALFLGDEIYTWRYGRSDVEPVKITPSAVLSVTGALSLKKVFKTIFKKLGEHVLELEIKNFLKHVAIMFVVAAIINVMPYTIYTRFYDESHMTGEILYSDGGIRTFSPTKMTPLSCVRLDELGCNKDEILWVNETKYCYTTIVLRELGDLRTWLNALGSKFGVAEENWYCNNMEEKLGPLAQLGTSFTNICSEEEMIGGACYKNTLTACYSYTCIDVCKEKIIYGSCTTDDDCKKNDICKDGKCVHKFSHFGNVYCEQKQMKAFQYWVGTNADPAGFGGPFVNYIRELKVKRANKSDYPWSNGIILEARGVYPVFD